MVNNLRDFFDANGVSQDNLLLSLKTHRSAYSRVIFDHDEPLYTTRIPEHYQKNKLQTKRWSRRRENRSSIQLLDQAQYEKNQKNSAPYIWEGRAALLAGRVELINSHVVQQFDTFFTTYQQVLNNAFDTSCKELFPNRF
jgi:hypothetical protein